MSCSTEARPCTSPTAIEKKVKSATSTTFGVGPEAEPDHDERRERDDRQRLRGDHQRIDRAAHAAATSRPAIASATATTIATTMPNTASFVVVSIAGHRLERSSQVERATRPGRGQHARARRRGRAWRRSQPDHAGGQHEHRRDDSDGREAAVQRASGALPEGVVQRRIRCYHLISMAYICERPTTLRRDHEGPAG